MTAQEIYELSTDDGATWTQVTKQQWIAVECACGFSGPDDTEPATRGFHNGATRGRIRRQPS